MRGKQVTRLRILLDDLTKAEREQLKARMGKFRVVIVDEPCLTCVLPNTEILSLRTGYRRIEDIQKDGSIVSHKGYSTRIDKRMEFYYSGKVVEITGVGMRPVSFTEDHEVWVKEKRRGRKVWKFAGDVVKGDYLIVPKIVVKGKSHPLMIDSEIIGMFVADGFVDLLENQCRSVVIRQKKYQDVKTLIEKNGLIPHVYKNSGSYLIEIHDVKLAQWLRWNFYDDNKNKVLPSWFLKLPKEEIVKFLRGYLHDGYIAEQGIIGYSSKSKKLIDQVSVLLLRLGVFPKLSYEEEEKEYDNYKWKSKMYKIRLSVKHSQMLAQILGVSYPKRKLKIQRRKWQIIDTKRYFYVPIKEIKETTYKGLVKNIQTRSGTFTLPFVVHNCGHKRRLEHVEKTDGKKELVRECLYCLCKFHTQANKEGE